MAVGGPGGGDKADAGPFIGLCSHKYPKDIHPGSASGGKDWMDGMMDLLLKN